MDGCGGRESVRGIQALWARGVSTTTLIRSRAGISGASSRRGGSRHAGVCGSRPMRWVQGVDAGATASAGLPSAHSARRKRSSTPVLAWKTIAKGDGGATG